MRPLVLVSLVVADGAVEDDKVMNDDEVGVMYEDEDEEGCEEEEGRKDLMPTGLKESTVERRARTRDNRRRHDDACMLLAWV